MQQVKRSASASAIAIDPRRGYPVQKRNGSRALAGLNRKWVVHRQLFIKLIAALSVAFLLAVTFQARGGIMVAANHLANLMQGEFAEAGLGIEEINMTGQSLTAEWLVLDALEVDDKTSILGYDANAARERLMALPAVADATLRKVYPNQLIVNITEKQAVARWRVDGVTTLIDRSGAAVAPAQPADSTLPLIIGQGAGDDAAMILKALEMHPDLAVGLAALSRLADRRWDMIYKSGLRVRLPEAGVAQALDRLEYYQAMHQILERDLAVIDLRVESVLAVQPNERDKKDS